MVLGQSLPSDEAHMSLEEHHKPGTRHAVAARFLLGLIATLALGGCLSTVPIKAEDNRVFIPALRAGINLDGDKQDASEPQTGRAFELGLAKAKGSGNQSIGSNQEQLIFNYTAFTGPQLLRNDFDFTFVNISWRWRKFFREGSLGMELLGGVGVTSLGLTVSSSTQRASGSFDTAGGQGGVGLILRLRERASLQARVSAFVSGDDQGVTSIGRYEFFYAHALDKNLTLRAGYAGWALRGSSGASMSNFQLGFSGLAVVLDWDINLRNPKLNGGEKVPD